MSLADYENVNPRHPTIVHESETSENGKKDFNITKL